MSGPRPEIAKRLTMATRTGKTGTGDGIALTARFVLGVLAALMMVVVQTMPAVASQGGGAISWIEICSDGGASYVPSTDGHGPANDECDRCDCCLSRSDPGAILTAPAAPAARGLRFPATVAAPVANDAPAAERALWPEKRGPPATMKSENMTSPRTTRFRRYQGDLSDMGGVPCV